MTVVNPDKTTTKRSFPGHTIYVAYLRLTNNQTQSDVMVRHSDDCGATWAAPVKVNDATSLANEGAGPRHRPGEGARLRDLAAGRVTAATSARTTPS